MTRIAILHSGDADRLDQLDTLQQAQDISRLLVENGYHITLVPVSAETDGFTLITRLQQIRPDKVVNLVETFAGSDSQVYQITALLDCLKIPYTGTKTTGLLLTADKLVVKAQLKAANITTPPWLTMKDRLAAAGSTAYIIKSATEHGSFGIEADSVVDNPQQLLEKLRERATTFGGVWFAEQYIAGREFNVGMLEINQSIEILPVAQMHFLNTTSQELRVFGYQAKWDESCASYHTVERDYNHPPEDAALIEQIKAMSVSCWELFKLRGYARVDFRVDEHNVPWIIDINANPCLSLDAGLMVASEEHSLTPIMVLEHILQAV